MVLVKTNFRGRVRGRNIALDSLSDAILDEAVVRGWTSRAEFVRAALRNSAMSCSFVTVSPNFRKPSLSEAIGSTSSSTG